MKSKIMTALLIVSLGLNLGVLAAVGNHWLHRRQFRGGIGAEDRPEERMRKMLNLTTEQTKAMELDRKEFQKQIDPIRDELQKKRQDLFVLLDTDKVDQGKVDKLINDLSALQIKMERTVIGHLLEVKKNLTLEQQEKFKKIFKQGFIRKLPEPGDKDFRERKWEH